MPDKLILVTREDLSPAQQAVQAAHALRAFIEQYPAEDKRWFKQSNTLALLAVEDEHGLHQLWCHAVDEGVKVSGFQEPDLGESITALALEPGPVSRRLARGLPLALSG